MLSLSEAENGGKLQENELNSSDDGRSIQNKHALRVVGIRAAEVGGVRSGRRFSILQLTDMYTSWTLVTVEFVFIEPSNLRKEVGGCKLNRQVAPQVSKPVDSLGWRLSRFSCVRYRMQRFTTQITFCRGTLCDGSSIVPSGLDPYNEGS